jgi:hypothetical protein
VVGPHARVATEDATCHLNELGVIRVCAQLAGGRPAAAGKVDASGVTPLACLWPDAVSLRVVVELRQAETARQVMDCYLLGLARGFGERVATCNLA